MDIVNEAEELFDKFHMNLDEGTAICLANYIMPLCAEIRRLRREMEGQRNGHTCRESHGELLTALRSVNDQVRIQVHPPNGHNFSLEEAEHLADEILECSKWIRDTEDKLITAIHRPWWKAKYAQVEAPQSSLESGPC